MTPKKENTKYIIQDREAGNFIAEFGSREEVEKELNLYEDIDRAEGTYTPDFYEIVAVAE